MAKFTISKSKVVEQYNSLKEKCDLISYSSKTNQVVAKILEEETDCMFSIHFVNELIHNKDMSRVLFLAQAWNEEDIKELFEQGIRSFVVDNLSDLKEIENYLDNNKEKVTLMLRMKLKENTLKTERYFVFGMKSEIINENINRLKEKYNERIKLGVHFHRKTQNISEWSFKFEISQILEETTLKNIEFMNIGGGLPSEYANTNMDVMNSIFVKIEELRMWLKENDIKLIIEPGRYISAPAGKLITKIIGMHENNIIIDASVYNSNMDAILVPVKLKVKNEVSKEEGKPFVIKGITPCSMDLFRYRVYLKDAKVGDELIFINAGAYNFSSNFCDLKELKTEVVQ